jgi:hypothetical protein
MAQAQCLAHVIAGSREYSRCFVTAYDPFGRELFHVGLVPPRPVQVRSLGIPRARVLELGGFSSSSPPALLSSTGGWAFHGCSAGLVGLVCLACFCLWASLFGAPPHAGAWASFAGLGGSATGLVVTRAVWSRRRKTSGFERLARLHTEIDRYNGLVSTLEMTERLVGIGGFPDVAERTRLLAALRSTRDELVRALALERLLREHRELLRDASSTATLTLAPSEAARVQMSGAACCTMLRDTFAVAASVREEVKRLERAPDPAFSPADGVAPSSESARLRAR